jgi:hypothetical protein
VISAATAAPRCRQASNPSFLDVRLLAALALLGIWHAASLLHGSTVVTALFTIGAAVLAVWAVAALRGE